MMVDQLEQPVRKKGAVPFTMNMYNLGSDINVHYVHLGGTNIL